MSYRIVRPDGDVRDVFSRVRAERSGEAEVTRVTGVLQDVTSSHALNREMARVNERLSKVNQLNADVLGVVGHDVRTPLALVLGHLEELSATWEEETEETKQMRVDKAFGAARRLSALIDDILAMANFDSGTIATRPVRADLREVVTEALAGLHGASKVEVHIDGSPVSYIDPFHLRQMVANLVSNALRYGALPVVVTVARGRRRRLARGHRRRRGRTGGLRPAPVRPVHAGHHRDRRTAVGQWVRPLHREPAGRGERLPPHLLARGAVRIALPARAPPRGCIVLSGAARPDESSLMKLSLAPHRGQSWWSNEHGLEGRGRPGDTPDAACGGVRRGQCHRATARACSPSRHPDHGHALTHPVRAGAVLRR